MGEFDLKTSVDALEHTDFGSLLGAPLQACVDAQMQAAYATTDYLDRVCFKYNPETETYETVTVSVARSKKMGRYHMMSAQNPVTVVTLAGGNPK